MTELYVPTSNTSIHSSQHEHPISTNTNILFHFRDTHSSTPQTTKKRKPDELEPEQKRTRLLDPIELQQQDELPINQDFFQPTINFNQDETTDFTCPLITLEPLVENAGDETWYLPNSPPIINDLDDEVDFVPDLLSEFNSDEDNSEVETQHLSFEQLELKLFDCISPDTNVECTTDNSAETCNNSV